MKNFYQSAWCYSGSLPRYKPEAVIANWKMIDVLAAFGDEKGNTNIFTSPISTHISNWKGFTTVTNHFIASRRLYGRGNLICCSSGNSYLFQQFIIRRSGMK